MAGSIGEYVPGVTGSGVGCQGSAAGALGGVGRATAGDGAVPDVRPAGLRAGAELQTRAARPGGPGVGPAAAAARHLLAAPLRRLHEVLQQPFAVGPGPAQVSLHASGGAAGGAAGGRGRALVPRVRGAGGGGGATRG